MQARSAWLGLAAALAFGSAAAGSVYAQSAEPSVEPAAEAEGDSFDDLEIPEMLPGYYTQTIILRSLSLDLPTKLGRGLGRSINSPPQTERFCHTGGDLQRASEFLPGWADSAVACRIVSSSLEGTHGEGEMRCAGRGVRMAIRYSGEFTETSARAAFTGEFGAKNDARGAVIKFDIAVDRIAETCTEDIAEGQDDAAATAIAEAVKKM